MNATATILLPRSRILLKSGTKSLSAETKYGGRVVIHEVLDAGGHRAVDAFLVSPWEMVPLEVYARLGAESTERQFALLASEFALAAAKHFL